MFVFETSALDDRLPQPCEGDDRLYYLFVALESPFDEHLDCTYYVVGQEEYMMTLWKMLSLAKVPVLVCYEACMTSSSLEEGEKVIEIVLGFGPSPHRIPDPSLN